MWGDSEVRLVSARMQQAIQAPTTKPDEQADDLAHEHPEPERDRVHATILALHRERWSRAGRCRSGPRRGVAGCSRLTSAPAIALLILALAAPAFAQDAEINCKATPELCIALPPKEAARLAARDADLDAVQAQVKALEAVVAAQRRQIDAQEKVIALQDEEIKRRERITALADAERDIHQGRAERAAKDAAKGALWLRIQARAGTGALLGVAAATVFPPAAILGPAVGALVGLVEHWLVD